MLAAVLWVAYASPVAALDLNPANYFKLTYEPVTFDKTEVAAGETFHATFKGKASCTKSLPFSPSQATINWRVIARHNASGAGLTLNESYVISIDPFPHKKGETFEINQTIPLNMPSNAAPGDYTITGQLIEAKVKILFLWQGVTGSFPKEQSMGTVKVIGPETAPPAQEPMPTASESKAPALASAPAPAATPAPEPVISPEPSPEPPETNINWWVVLLLIVLVGGGIAGITLLLRHRRKES